TLHLCLSFRACRGMVNPDDPSDHRAHTTTSTHNHDRLARTTPGPSSSAAASPAVAPVADCSRGLRGLGRTCSFYYCRGSLLLFARAAVTGLVAKLPTESSHPSLFQRSTAHRPILHRTSHHDATGGHSENAYPSRHRDRRCAVLRAPGPRLHRDLA